MTEDESRKQFEAWISGPPFEYHVSRYRSDGAWTGVYMSAQVDLAWQAWQAAHASHTVAYGLFWETPSKPNAAKLISHRLYWDLESAQDEKPTFPTNIQIREIGVTVGEVVQ